MSRPINVGDEVRVLHRADEIDSFYGRGTSRKPFIVLRGDGMLVYRKDCRRTRTALQVDRDAAK